MEVTEWHDVLLQHMGLKGPVVPQGAGLDAGLTDPRGKFIIIWSSAVSFGT